MFYKGCAIIIELLDKTQITFEETILKHNCSTFATAPADKRIKAVATLSLFNTGDVRRNGYMRTQLGDIHERLRKASLARQREAMGEKPEVAGFADMTIDEARKIKQDLYREGYFYYAVTHKTPTAPGSYLVSALLIVCLLPPQKSLVTLLDFLFQFVIAQIVERGGCLPRVGIVCVVSYMIQFLYSVVIFFQLQSYGESKESALHKMRFVARNNGNEKVK